MFFLGKCKLSKGIFKTEVVFLPVLKISLNATKAATSNAVIKSFASSSFLSPKMET